MTHLESLLDFVRELDDMKTILRRTRVIATGRREDDAQHSWHISTMAVLLADYANEPVDLVKTLTMLLFHDVVEIDAGDTYCYDPAAAEGKEKREQAAAERIYGQLPKEIGQNLYALWQEFERGESPEARFAVALDRSQPIFNNYYGKGGSWQEHGVKKSQVLERIAPVRDGSALLYAHIRELVEKGVQKGWLIDA